MAGADLPRRRWPFRLALIALVLALLGPAGWLTWRGWASTLGAADRVDQARQSWLAGCRTAASPQASPAPTAGSPTSGSSGPVLPARTAEAEALTPGTVIGTITLPGQEQAWPILAGVGGDQLARGVGWYPSSGPMGVTGNFALAGYRFGHARPFAHLLDLQRGDQLVVSDCLTDHLYTVEVAPAELTVGRHDDWVLDAVPGRPGQQPGAALLTLTTELDLLPTGRRAVGMAVLTGTRPRS